MHDPDLHLLVDDDEIQHYTNLLRVINKPYKYPEPVLAPDQPWEGQQRLQAWGSVIREPDGLFRAWYYSMDNPNFDESMFCRGGYGYAESQDGIHWEKPKLGLIDFGGNTDNNLFYTFAPDKKQTGDYDLARRRTGIMAYNEDGAEIGLVNHMDGFTVLRDDDESDPDKRYKLFGNMQNHLMWAQRDRYGDLSDEEIERACIVFGQYIDTSPDGLRWSHMPRRFLPAKYGDYMMVTRDHRNRQWLINQRTLGLGGRTAGIVASKDLYDWPEMTPMAFAPGPEAAFGDQFEWHAGMTPFNYGNLDLGLLEKWTNQGLGHACELISHRDGQSWHRVAPGTMFLNTGAEGSFDRMGAWPTHNPPIRVGDKLHVYYTSIGVRPHPEIDGPMAIGLATIGVDRFAGLANSRGPAGELLTKPIRIDKPKLTLNVEELRIGDVRAAVRSPDGSFIGGYEHEDSQIDFRSDPFRCEVRWSSKSDLSELLGQTVWLHFQIAGATLYSYRFSDK